MTDLSSPTAALGSLLRYRDNMDMSVINISLRYCSVINDVHQPFVMIRMCSIWSSISLSLRFSLPAYQVVARNKNPMDLSIPRRILSAADAVKATDVPSTLLVDCRFRCALPHQARQYIAARDNQAFLR